MTIDSASNLRTDRWILYTLGLLLLASVTLADAAERGQNRAKIEPYGSIYGGALGIRSEIYVGYNQRVIPLPILGYRGEKLRIFGPFVNYEAYRDGAFGFDVKLSPRFNGFDDYACGACRGRWRRPGSMPPPGRVPHTEALPRDRRISRI